MDVLARRAAAVLAFPLLSACASMRGDAGSPLELGIDVRVAPGFKVERSGRTTIHPTVAYSRSIAGGVAGEHTQLIHIGGQIRVAQGRYNNKAGPWLGGEATFARRRTSYDFAGVGPDWTNGFTVAALAGVPLSDGSVGTLHGYVAAGMRKYRGGRSLFSGRLLPPARVPEALGATPAVESSRSVS